MCEVIILEHNDSYGRYKNSRDAAWKILIDFNIRQLPVKLSTIAKQANITIKKNSDINLLDSDTFAISFLMDDKWYIIYNDIYKNTNMVRFSIAHEMGHIFLGHELSEGYHQRTFNLEKPQVETEADIFASRLLAPACVLWGLDLHTADEIQKICDISISAAKIRAERMSVLYKRNKFLISPLERQVFDNFKDYIKSINNLKESK